MPFIKTAFPAGAGQALDPVASPDSVATAVTRLADPDPAVRRAAAQLLGRQSGAAPVAALADALAAETAQPVRSALLAALADIGSEESVAALADCLRREDAWLRNAAIELLRGLPASHARLTEQLMAHLLADWDRDVRILAVGILDTLRHERVEEWLLQLIDADPDVNVCGVALDVLAQVATDAARGPVARLVERFPDEPYIGFAADLVLGRLAAERAPEQRELAA